MNHPDNCIVNNTGEWHFNKLVYGGKQNIKGDLLVDTDHIKKTQSYNYSWWSPTKSDVWLWLYRVIFCIKKL